MVTTIVRRKLKTPLEKKFTGKEPPRPVERETANYLEFNAAVEKDNAERFSRELEASASSAKSAANKNGHAAAAPQRKEVRRARLTERGTGAAAALNPTLPPGARPIFQDPIVRLPLAQLLRHPDNREPLAADIAERAASIKVHGILEPIIARLLDSGRYQVLSGETRWRAVEQIGESEIPARVVECDDARALELLAEFNAQRKDLDPIRKARLIERLCQAKEAGGAGLTREQAGRIYGLESGGAVSNLVGLLRLPAVWQKRVASGELAWTWARELVPYAAADAVFEELEEDWGNRDQPYNDTFHSRQCLLDALESIVRYELRPLRAEEVGLYDLDPDCRTELGIVQLPVREGGKTRPMAVATNADAYDRLRANSRRKESQAAASQVGADEPPEKQKLTKAQERAKAEERSKQLGKGIMAWRHKLLRQACIQAIDSGLDSGLRIVLAAAADPSRSNCELHFNAALEQARGVKPRGESGDLDYWPCVAEVEDLTNGQADSDVVMAIAKLYLGHESGDRDRPTLPHKLVESYAQAIGVVLAQAWSRIQRTVDGNTGADLLEEFFLLHRTDELKDLAEELGVHLMPSLTSKGQIVKLLLSVPQGTRTLPLPKAIKPLPSGGDKRKAAKGKR